MKILVIGGGGREAALCARFAQGENEVFCAPGNAGIARYATCVPIKASGKPEDNHALLKFVEEHSIDLTVVGPEAPLVGGIVDLFQGCNRRICGPSAKAAQSEGSKAWFKNLLAKHNLPTAPYKVFNDSEKALAYIHERSVQNIVIKADGLMGGKGVTLPNSLEEAEQDLKKLMVKGTAGEIVVIEDRLVGIERSVMALVCGRQVYMLSFTQDYKREGDGDTGRNTGGMGAHTVALSADEAAALEHILCSVVEALDAEGCTYTGFMYLGFIMTKSGPMVLECNCRLGDPETEVILPSMSGDFAKLCLAIAEGDLAREQAPRQVCQALCVTLASRAYPDASIDNHQIIGISEAEVKGAIVYHAGTAKCGDALSTMITTNKSGRVLCVAGVGETIEAARSTAYLGVDAIVFNGKKFRKDIGAGV